MSAYNFIPLALHPVRDPNFVTPDEAAQVAASLLADPIGATINKQPDGSQITGVQVNPPAPNLYADGRVYIVLNFTLQMPVTNSMGRQVVVTVPFSEVSGILFDLLTKTQPWKFIAVPNGNDTWIGDVEREG